MILADDQTKITYMVADDETEETLLLVAMLENIPQTRLYEIIDTTRNAGCGFARAARIFGQNYLKAFSISEYQDGITPNSTVFAMKQAMASVANDLQTAEQE